MNPVNYTQMSDKQLKKYLVKNRNDKAALQVYLNRRHQNSNPVIATLNEDDFEDKIIAIIEEENYLINVFPVNNKTGFVVTLQELIRDLNDELEQYE